jgi:hypothetical protein
MVADAGDVLMHNVPCMFITVHPSAAPLLPRLTSVCYNISWNVYLTTRLELTQLRSDRSASHAASRTVDTRLNRHDSAALQRHPACTYPCWRRDERQRDRHIATCWHCNYRAYSGSIEEDTASLPAQISQTPALPAQIAPNAVACALADPRTNSTKPSPQEATFT